MHIRIVVRAAIQVQLAVVAVSLSIQALLCVGNGLDGMSRIPVHYFALRLVSNDNDDKKVVAISQKKTKRSFSPHLGLPSLTPVIRPKRIGVTAPEGITPRFHLVSA